MHSRILVASICIASALAVPAAASPPAAAAQRVSAAGQFTVDTFTPVSAVPVGASSCLITGTVTLTFRGTLAGAAGGPIRIVTQAACGQPSGSGPDAFAAQLNFHGTIAGRQTITTITYAGTTNTRGAVSGSMAVARPRGVLQVSGTVGVEGDYRGSLNV